MAIQWLGLHASTAEGTGSIPCQGTKIPQACAEQPKKKRGNNKLRMLSSRKIEGEKLTFFCIQYVCDRHFTYAFLLCIIDTRFHFPSFDPPAFKIFN